MTRWFCTLFDSGYLTRGVALYESLVETGADFRLVIIALDDECVRLLRSLELEKAAVVPLAEMEDPELLTAKPTRTWEEYCWTLTPSVIRWSIRNYDLDDCTYLDADMYFWHSPEELLTELEGHSLMLTEHRYSAKYENTKRSGRFCVQFMPFRNDELGMIALEWWRDRCIEWCYNRREDGKFGDQLYLHDWPDRFEGVHVLEHVGGGLAPWNFQDFDLFETDAGLQCRMKATGVEGPMVFYHFHRFKIGADRVAFGPFRIDETTRRLLYGPYLRRLEAIAARLDGAEDRVRSHGGARLRNNKLDLTRNLLLGSVMPRAELRAL